jgi:uncharacterized protein YuzE
MKVRYFPDTGTLLITLSDKRMAETRDLTDNILVELDGEGRQRVLRGQTHLFSE